MNVFSLFSYYLAVA